MKNHFYIYFLVLFISKTWSQNTQEITGLLSEETVDQATTIVGGGGGGSLNNTIVFDYDTAGNQIKRMVIYLSTGRMNPNAIDSTSTPNKELIESDLFADISYYPNPVKSELYVKWKNTNEKSVNNIAIYAMTGQLMRNFQGLKNTDNTNINFEYYPKGIYNLILIYSNGEKKTLKIAKQ